MDGAFLPDTLSLLDDAAAIGRFLLFEDVEQHFTFARQARIAYLLHQPALTLRGEPADAYIAVGTVQGAHRLAWQFLLARFAHPELYPLDFLIYIDHAAWERRGWNAELGPSTFPIEREALIYHELCHLRQLVTSDGEPRYHEDGREMLALRSHTYEFFQEEIQRFGPRTLNLDAVGTDYVIGHKAEIHRARPQLRRVK